jgi:hypothetical protein
MGFALPSGVVNTNSAYFYADAANVFGTLVKELDDQTLIVLDYSQVTPPVTLTSYSFTVDVTSNPALVVSYTQLNATGTVLTFLVSGGIVGQQYNLTVVGNNELGARDDVLTINIPSSQGSCQSINPVPAIYTQVPLGSEGYVNTALRYFWGRTPPANPSVLDQWYDPTSNTLSEWATDGTKFFWELITASNMVTEARSDGVIYGRFMGNWVAEPIQSDAPSNLQTYSRGNSRWVLNPIQNDAPNDGHLYCRQSLNWVVLPQEPILTDAPIDGNLYGRMDAGWAIVPSLVITVDAPADGNSYMRNNVGWSSGGTLTGSLDVIGNVAIGGTLSVQQPSFFTGNVTAYGSVAIANDPISNEQAANKHYVDNAIINAFNANGSPFLQLAGGTMAGAIKLAFDPVTPMEPVSLQYFQAHAPGGLTDANADGTTYGRQNHLWVNVLAVTGGTLTGPLVLAGAPSVTNGAANKGYVDSAITASVPQPSGSPPPMDGTAATGASLAYARADHVHPSDASKYNASNPSGYQTAAQMTAALANYYPTSNPSGYQTAAQLTSALANYYPVSNPSGYQTAAQVTASLGAYLPLAGGSLTGELKLLSDGGGLGRLTFVANYPFMTMNCASFAYSMILGEKNGINRWSMLFPDGTSEIGGDAGSLWSLTPWSDNGTQKAAALTIDRNLIATFGGEVVLAVDPVSPLDAATKQYVDNISLDCGTF